MRVERICDEMSRFDAFIGDDEPIIRTTDSALKTRRYVGEHV
jgi:hypothetical protein